MEYQYKNIKVNYEVVGNGKPVIILHGFKCELNLMKCCLEPVFLEKSGYKRFYIDLPGMGKSGNELDYASSDGILEVLTGLISNLVQEEFLVIGQSFGGYLARGILTRFADNINGMMLLCPVIIPQRDRRTLPSEVMKFEDTVFLNQLSEADRNEFCEFAIVANAETYKRYCEEVLKGIRHANDRFVNKLDNSYSFTFDVDNIIKNIKFDKPVLFICGRQDNCVGFEDAWKLMPDYPRATFSVIDTAGHNLQIEQPELFHELVCNWLVRVEKFASTVRV